MYNPVIKTLASLIVYLERAIEENLYNILTNK